ncbi:rod shape-determining protein RodA [Bacillus lacus]|uniref:Rod shape-determining protein RodA n=1 Tax=Metabacillus lacus TaxID=1983721 RepID=A0A7X2IXS0_9BACI|nr:rod shape-determining protein RodA [Metabacillus lacus]MRX71621.1 rod shape-determining protein RodA [Metabacillus lacus]
MENDKQLLSSRIDFQLAFILFLLFCTSCIAIYSAQTSSGQYSANFVFKQIVFYSLGTLIVAAIMYFDSEQLQRLTWYFYGFGLLLLSLLIFAPEPIAPEINGAKSWFKFPLIGNLQPSEFMKTFIILALSSLIAKHNTIYQEKTLGSDMLLLIKMCVTCFVPILLIMKQPDLGTSLVILAIMTGMIFVSGISWKIITAIFTVIGTAAGVIFYFILQAPQVLTKYLGVKQYQFGRIYAWLSPEDHKSDEGYHLVNSLKAIGSGQVFGKGFGKTDVYIPENHTDFIFSVIGEQFGFLGTSIVLSVFFLLVYHLVKVAMETNEPFNSYICTGIISMIVFHVFQNAGMTIGLLPITGIPLPFVSYGGSSLIGMMLAMGLVFGIRYHHRVYMFSND